MSGGLSRDESEALRRTVRDVLGRHGSDPSAAWKAIADLGLLAIVVPESLGGHGGGRAELSIVHEEMGRALFEGPFLSTTMAISLLLATEDDTAGADLLPRLAAGTLTGAVAVQESTGDWLPGDPACVARRGSDGWTLHGVKTHVIGGDVVDLLLVLAAAPEGPSVFAVGSDDPRVRVEPQPVMDETRSQATVALDDAPARPVGRPGAGLDAVRAMMTDAAIALAAEQVGAASRVLEFTVDHVASRTQFGVPVGSFQAVKHLCADMTLDVESARALVDAAVTADPDDLAAAAHAAKSFCAEAGWRVASTAVQLHGGIGFTWEHDAQRYFKRAKSSELLLGSPAEHRRALLAELGV